MTGAGLNLAQANDWARFFDKATADKAKEPATIAWTAFKNKYKKVGDIWVSKDNPTKNTRGNSKMSKEIKENIDNISLFQDDGTIDKLKAIIEKLETADSIEAAKVLVVELKDLLPIAKEALKEEEKKDEKTKEDTKPAEKEGEEVKEETVAKPEGKKEGEPEAEVVKKEGEAGEETKVETKEAEVVVEKPAEAVKESSLSEALKINDELISQMGIATAQIGTLEQINSKLKENNSQLSEKLAVTEKELSQFKDTEKKEAETRFSTKLESTLGEYCKFMGIPEDDKKSVEKMMSTFSEDMLEKTMGYIKDKEISQMKDEPDPKTVQSSQLNSEKTRETLLQSYTKLESAKDRTDFLFDVMTGMNPVIAKEE